MACVWLLPHNKVPCMNLKAINVEWWFNWGVIKGSRCSFSFSDCFCEVAARNIWSFSTFGLGWKHEVGLFYWLSSPLMAQCVILSHVPAVILYILQFWHKHSASHTLVPPDLTFRARGEVGAWYESRVTVQHGGGGRGPQFLRIDKARVQHSW